MGPHIKTASGRRWFLLNPDPNDVAIEDIAHALSNICRFNGHSSRFYSVAQHSVLVQWEVKAKGGGYIEQMWALLHDASEAYLGDVTGPLKRTPLMAAYRDLESETMAAICYAFHIPWHEPPIVKEADQALLAAEQAQLTPPWIDGAERTNCDAQGEPADIEIQRWSQNRSEGAFLNAYHRTLKEKP